MNIRFTAPLVTVAAILMAGPAQAQDLFGRTETYYDLTNSPLVRQPLDYDYIGGRVPTYAEQKGLTGLPTVEIRRNYVYVEDTDGSLTIPWQSQQDLFESFNFALREVYDVLPDEFIFVYLFTSFNTNVGAFFYSPEANDVRGIGSQRIDSNGFSPREGFVFMNYWQYFDEAFQGAPQAAIDAQRRSVFNQEAGHRWASFITAGADGGGAGADVLLGRDDGHWSYFLNSGGSPMEGNAWRDNQNGTFTTITGFDNWHYSDLDLYLMGLLPAAQVSDWFVITGPNVNGQRDIFGRPITRSSPPQIIQQVTVSGTRVDMGIEDIQTQHGLRDPAAGVSPTEWKVVFVMLAGQSSPLAEPAKQEFEALVDEYALGFHQGTRNLGTLDYVLMGEPRSPIGGPCESVDDCNQLEANLCFPQVGQPPVGLCTRPCSDAGSCPTGWCCDALGGNGSAVCLPDAMCEPEPPVCECDLTMGQCDEGCACDTVCEEMMNTCACDTGAECQDGCACDPHCSNETMEPEICACDVTYGCDRDGGASCGCDPECKSLDRDRGSGCTATETGASPYLSGFLIALLAFAFSRRRK